MKVDAYKIEITFTDGTWKIFNAIKRPWIEFQGNFLIIGTLDGTSIDYYIFPFSELKGWSKRKEEIEI